MGIRFFKTHDKICRQIMHSKSASNYITNFQRVLGGSHFFMRTVLLVINLVLKNQAYSFFEFLKTSAENSMSDSHKFVN